MTPKDDAVMVSRIFFEEPLCRRNQFVRVSRVEGPERVLTIDQTWISHDVASCASFTVVQSAMYDISCTADAKNFHQTLFAELIKIVVGGNISKYRPLGLRCYGS